MFSAEELASLDRSYFTVICADAFDVTVISKNTGHTWYIHNPEYPEEGSCIIFHKHKTSHPYHKRGKARSLGMALRGIRRHDAFQLNGRKPVEKDAAGRERIAGRKGIAGKIIGSGLSGL